MRAPLNGVFYNARTIKWCLYIMRAPLNRVLYNARTIKWCIYIMRAPLNGVLYSARTIKWFFYNARNRGALSLSESKSFCTLTVVRLEHLRYARRRPPPTRGARTHFAAALGRAWTKSGTQKSRVVTIKCQ